MREITTHKGNELDDALTIRAYDRPNQPGGACHSYEIVDRNRPWSCSLSFQDGPVKESGVNGISIESLLAICIDRLEGFQSGPYATSGNGIALSNLRSALDELKARTKNRQARGVEGTSAL